MKNTIKELDTMTDTLSKRISKLYMETWDNKATQNNILFKLSDIRSSIAAVRHELNVEYKRS